MLKRAVKILVFVVLVIGLGAVSYYIFKDVSAKREIRRLEAALSRTPDNIEDKHRLGLLYMYEGDYKRAEEELLGILG